MPYEKIMEPKFMSHIDKMCYRSACATDKAGLSKAGNIDAGVT